MTARGPAVVFDFDGTLIDTHAIKTRNYVRAFETVFGTGRDLRPAVEASCLRTSGANRFVQLEDTLAAAGLTATDEQRAGFSRVYSDLNGRDMESVREFPSVRRVLDRLARAGYTLFAASGILEEEFRRELTRRGLATLFTDFRGGDKRGFLESLTVAGYAPIAFVGDTSYDRVTAEQARVDFHLVMKDADLTALLERLTPDV